MAFTLSKSALRFSRSQGGPNRPPSPVNVSRKPTSNKVKLNAEKEVAKHKIETRKTGGGPPPPPPNTTSLKIVEIIGAEAVDGVLGGIDTSITPENGESVPSHASTSDQAASQLPLKKRTRINEIPEKERVQKC